jgi:NADH-quinone oxidoreductase subunit G
MRGNEVFRVTARKDEWGEVKDSTKGNPGWICNECRFDKKQVSDWTIEGPTAVSRQSVISQGHYVNSVQPKETLEKVMDGRKPKLLMDIHSVSEVNRTNVELSLLNRPAHSTDFTK